MRTKIKTRTRMEGEMGIGRNKKPKTERTYNFSSNKSNMKTSFSKNLKKAYDYLQPW